MRIIIIEAIGKINTVKHAAKQRWGKDIAVLATGGYIWTFPNKSIGIDAKTLRPNADEKTKSGKYFEQALTKVIATYRNHIDEVILLTDPDREGEGIAAQAERLIKGYLPEVKTTRFYAQELNAEGLQSANSSPKLHEGIVQAQTARRVLDRLLPLSAAHQLHRDGDFMGLGRMQVATVRVVKDKTRQWKRHVLIGFWKTPQGSFFVREYDDSRERLNEKLQTLQSTKLTPSAIQHRSLTIPPPPAHSGQSILAGMLDERPADTMGALQNAYIQGRMSYPRSDQNMLGPVSIRTVAALAQDIHLGHLLRQQWFLESAGPQSGPGIIGAHSALYPTLGWSPIAGEATCVQEKVEMEIAARALASIMIPAKIERRVVALVTNEGQGFEVVQDNLKEPGWTAAYERLGLPNPLMPKQEMGVRYPRLIEQVPTQAHIIEWLNDETLGRPSTLAQLPGKMQALNLISAACVTTRFADKQLQDIQNVMPHYTYAAFSAFMERGLATIADDPSKYLDVIKSILVEAGADVVSLPVAIAKAKPVDLDDPELDICFESPNLVP